MALRDRKYRDDACHYVVTTTPPSKTLSRCTSFLKRLLLPLLPPLHPLLTSPLTHPRWRRKQSFLVLHPLRALLPSFRHPIAILRRRHHKLRQRSEFLDVLQLLRLELDAKYFFTCKEAFDDPEELAAFQISAWKRRILANYNVVDHLVEGEGRVVQDVLWWWFWCW
jgi:hypothetical protein